MIYELHPLCTLFPRLSGAEFDVLREDIKVNGLRSPIVLHQGMILDGGNRYRACIEAGIEPVFSVFEGGNLVSFVLSANLHRRHMTTGQQAAIVASAQDWAQAQAHGGNRRADQVATLPLETIKSRAAESGASERTQRMADKVARADPELAKRVAHGEMSLPKAVQQIAPKPEAKAAGKTQAEQIAEDAHGDGDPMAEMEAQIRELEGVVAALQVTEKDAELAKWRRMYDHAQRQQSEAMDATQRAKKREEWTHKQLMRCGKAVGQTDPDKIAPSVESFVRDRKGVPA